MGALATKLEDPTEDHPWFKRGNPLTLIAMAMIPIILAALSIFILAIFNHRFSFETKTGWLNIAFCAIYAAPIAFLIHMKLKGAIIGILAWIAFLWITGTAYYLMPWTSA